MTKLSRIFVSVLLGLLVAPVSAGQFDLKQPILCALQQLDECSAGEACVKVTPQSVSLPDFISIDLVNRQVSSAGTPAVVTSPVKGYENIQGKLILQGGDSSGDNPRGGVGWTLLLNENTGKMTIAGVGDGFAMVVIGSCVQR